MSDEDIIKKRLLIDGDGTGDDRRLNMLLKQFLKWTNSKNDSPENNQIVYDRLLAQLAQCQFAASKTEYTSKMIEEELKNYGKVSDQIEKNIEMAKQQIEESKKELVLAKQIRKNKMEYDLLAKLIKEQPDRKETMKQIDTLKKELDELVEKKIKLERKFQKRRNDFTLLMYCIRELEAQLEEDSSSDESSKSDVEDDVIGEGIASGGASIATVLNGSASVELMDLSDDDDEPISSNLNEKNAKRRKSRRLKDYSKEDDDKEDSKGPMSVDEDVVLELSIEKDDNDVVKIAESVNV